MRFSVVTLFPDMFAPVTEASLLGKAVRAGRLAVELVDPREFTSDRHRTADDTPYGGGPGMVVKPGPLVQAIEAAAERGRVAGAPPPRRILLTPGGAPLTQRRVRELAGAGHLVLVCGRYEGVDERAVEIAIDEELSLGDFVLTGGEIAAMAVIDAVSRYVPGVLGEARSTEEESFSDGLLEYPQYTRPATFRGREVPEVLVSGDHERIRRWRRQKALERTSARRPDLLAGRALAEEDRRLLGPAAPAALAARTFVILAHHPVRDRAGDVVTTSVTNLDIHDIARSAATYGLAGYLPVSPVGAQRDKIERIVAVWRDQAQREVGADRRADALAAVHAEVSIAAAVDHVEAVCGARPRVVATTAERGPLGDRPRTGTPALRRAAAASGAPLVLVFGTGFGLTREVLEQADEVLEPVAGEPRFNHLAVRSAVAVVLDRLFGLRDDGAGAHRSGPPA